MLCLCYPVASNDRGHSPSVQGQRHSLEKQSPSTKTLCVCVPSRLRRDGGFCCPPLRGWQYRRTVSIPPSAKSQTSCTATLDTQCPRTIAPSARCGFPPPSPSERAVQRVYGPVSPYSWTVFTMCVVCPCSWLCGLWVCFCSWVVIVDDGGMDWVHNNKIRLFILRAFIIRQRLFLGVILGYSFQTYFLEVWR